MQKLAVPENNSAQMIRAIHWIKYIFIVSYFDVFLDSFNKFISNSPNLIISIGGFRSISCTSKNTSQKLCYIKINFTFFDVLILYFQAYFWNSFIDSWVKFIHWFFNNLQFRNILQFTNQYINHRVVSS